MATNNSPFRDSFSSKSRMNTQFETEWKYKRSCHYEIVIPILTLHVTRHDKIHFVLRGRIYFWLFSNVITLEDLQVVSQNHLPRHERDERVLPQMTESVSVSDDIISVSKRELSYYYVSKPVENLSWDFVSLERCSFSRRTYHNLEIERMFTFE